MHTHHSKPNKNRTRLIDLEETLDTTDLQRMRGGYDPNDPDPFDWLPPALRHGPRDLNPGSGLGPSLGSNGMYQWHHPAT